MKKLTLYGVMSVISVIVRQFILPNPFECFGLIPSIIINIVAEPILHLLAFLIVGFFYESGDAPAFGSLAYLVVYAIIVGVLCLLAGLSVVWWIILIALAGALILVKIARWIVEVLL